MQSTKWIFKAGHWLAAALFGMAVLAGCVSLEDKERQWIFQPSKATWGGGISGIDGVQEVWIPFDSTVTGQAVRLNALWLPAESAQAPVLLYLHGARWDVTGSARRMERMRQLGFSVLGIDYRGFGKSGDELPSERMAYEDAEAAWRYLEQHYPANQRFIFGHSLGAAVAVNLATEESDATGLIVEGSFTSIADVFGTFKWGWLPVSGLITQRFDAASKIGKIKVPLLVVHGSEDRLIPPALGRALYDRAPEPKRFVLVDGGSHHNTNSVGQEQYRVALHEMYGL